MQEKLKILVTGDNGESLPPPYGGIIKRCLLHAKLWKAFGAEVFLHIYCKHDKEEDLGAGATYFYDFLKQPSLIGKILFVVKKFFKSPYLFLELARLQLKLSKLDNFSRILYCSAKGVYLNQKIKNIEPDIIITETGGLQSLVALATAKKNNLPIILENYAEFQYKDDELAWNYLINSVNLVVPPSEHCAQGPLKYANDPAKIKVVYSGVNFDIFNGQLLTDKTKARDEFNLPRDKFLIMAVGAFKMRKGHDQLFEAVLKLPEEKLKKVSVVLCGMGPIDDMRRKAEERGFSMDSLHFFQGLSEETLARLYSAVDCCCVTALTTRECMGMAMKEAMSIGLPVVAYNVGGVKEAIENGVNGFLVPMGDRQEMAGAIERTMRLSAEKRDFFKRNNIAKAQKLFDIKKTAAQLYEEILKIAGQKNEK